MKKSRKEYQATLIRLRSYYLKQRDDERARWAEDELRDYHRMTHPAYSTAFFVPGPNLTANKNVPEANKFVVDAKAYKGRTLGGDAQMRQASRANDANRTFLLGFTALVTLVILVSVGAVVSRANDTIAIALVLVTLSLSWLFSNVIYALHYAHIYYADDDGDDAGGLDFPDTDEPDYWDFLYFSVTLGMAFATSDVKIASARFRRIAIGQTLAAFVFNLGVIAFAVGALGGG